MHLEILCGILVITSLFLLKIRESCKDIETRQKLALLETGLHLTSPYSEGSGGGLTAVPR